MNNWNKWRRGALAVLTTTLLLAGCGGGDGDDASAAIAANPLPSEVANEVARASASAADGVVLTVPSGAAGLAGARVEIPADAAMEDIDVQVGFEDAPPGPFRAEAIAAGVTPVSKTMVLKVAQQKRAAFNKVVKITLPYDVTAANGLPPAVLYWDPEASVYRPVSVISVDRVAGTVTFQTSHFSSFLAVVLQTLKVSIPSVETGFAMKVDTILHPNFGSYDFGGHCAAFASLSTHYFSMKKATKLYAFAQEGRDLQPADDELTRTALTMTYGLLQAKWADVASNLVVPAADDTGVLMIASMIVTGLPVHVVLHDGSKNGHSVVAYAYDAVKGHFKIYDSNFPETDAFFDWKLDTGFGAYSRAASYSASMFSNIGYATDDTFGAPVQFQQIMADWEGGRLKDYFANLSIDDQEGATQPLSYGSAVTIKIAYEDNQTLVGRFKRPAGSTKPVYVHAYVNGMRVSLVGQLISGSGEFTVPFPSKLEDKLEVILLVSEHERDIRTGFSGFGKFTVQPDGKNFFVNFGFETGDLTGWSTQTTLLDSGDVWTPTKTAVVGIGFDPIATDIPTAVFGAHAARVNDLTPDYHTTYVSQRAVVPASGNPQLRFQWAAVLEDPQHDPDEQPYVDVVVLNVTQGTELYRKRFYTSDPSYTGWKSYTYQDSEWKAIAWQSVVLSGLASSAGDTIELKIIGADCALGGHGGYVYLDGAE